MVHLICESSLQLYHSAGRSPSHSSDSPFRPLEAPWDGSSGSRGVPYQGFCIPSLTPSSWPYVHLMSSWGRGGQGGLPSLSCTSTSSSVFWLRHFWFCRWWHHNWKWRHMPPLWWVEVSSLMLARFSMYEGGYVRSQHSSLLPACVSSPVMANAFLLQAFWSFGKTYSDLPSNF